MPWKKMRTMYKTNVCTNYNVNGVMKMIHTKVFWCIFVNDEKTHNFCHNASNIILQLFNVAKLVGIQASYNL